MRSSRKGKAVLWILSVVMVLSMGLLVGCTWSEVPEVPIGWALPECGSVRGWGLESAEPILNQRTDIPRFIIVRQFSEINNLELDITTDAYFMHMENRYHIMLNTISDLQSISIDRVREGHKENMMRVSIETDNPLTNLSSGTFRNGLWRVFYNNGHIYYEVRSSIQWLGYHQSSTFRRFTFKRINLGSHQVEEISWQEYFNVFRLVYDKIADSENPIYLNSQFKVRGV